MTRFLAWLDRWWRSKTLTYAATHRQPNPTEGDAAA